ncbi:MAG: hypothetical protein KDC85_06015 [Saprospiraceae bacterium]|nr:hypothetical protein [Saprospiraceae bacterium]MCB9323927.1 hypothetical protein [Lewinellaceae bacterium]
MNIDTLKRDLKNLFSENKIKTIIENLKEVLIRDSDLHSEFLQICRRYNEVYDRKMAALIEDTTANLELNKVGESILYLIDKMTQEDIKSVSKLSHQEITNPILLITNDPAKGQKLKAFLHQLNFTIVDIFTSAEDLENKTYDLAIIDNRHLAYCPNAKVLSEMEASKKQAIEERIKLMEQLIRDTSLFMIHFGEYFFWITDHRERIHAANSQFSLYGRTKEMLEFINTYRV